MKKLLLLGSAVTVLASSTAFAQSTGSIEAEDSIVVTGTRARDNVLGVQTPQTPKAKVVIGKEFIERRTPGQTILDTINLVPGVNFTNNDPYGSSGGNIRIRGFDGARISLTEDGIPLNDSGNYAIYSNQQLDPELISEANVNLGSADVDSPTASAAGGTINYRSITPQDDLGATVIYSHGSFDMNRVFGLIQTGTFTPFGTKAWFSASSQTYDQFRGFGKIDKKQYNAKIYQPIGDNGDFFSLIGHFNKNRTNFYSNPNAANLRTVLGAGVIPTTASRANPILVDLNDAQFDTVYDNTSPAFLYDRSCAVPTPGPGAQNGAATCGNYSGLNINPSNTANIRINSRYTLSDKLTLTFDGGYQYVRANGGGSSVWAESDAAAGASGLYNRQYSRLGAGIAPGVDLNGDGDLADTVRLYFPSNTRTNRLTAIVGLRYDLDDNNLVRVGYTWDRARHRQTGEASLLDGGGNPLNPFSAVKDDSLASVDAAGNVLQKRDRLSYAILHQLSAEYRGSFFDNNLKLALGLRAPFFKRNLTNNCYTIPGSSNDAYCTSQTPAQVAANPATAGFGAPYKARTKKYDALLPNAGLTYNFTPEASIFASYAKGFSAPRTDNLYAFDDVTITPVKEVSPEKTDSFDLGLRYNSRIITAQLSAWYVKYNNRIISSTIELEGGGTLNADRNVGAVDTKGVDLSIGIRPVTFLSVYGFASYFDSKLKENALSPAGAIIAATKGAFVVESPKWQYGGRAELNVEPFSAGVQVKHVGKRYVTDINDVVTGAYTLVDLDVRVSLAPLKLEKTYFQLNVTNLLKEKYFGNLSTTTDLAGGPRFTFGAPRSISGSLHFQF